MVVQVGWIAGSCARVHQEPFFSTLLDRSYIAGIELGNRNPSLKALEQLASALHVRLAELFED